MTTMVTNLHLDEQLPSAGDDTMIDLERNLWKKQQEEEDSNEEESIMMKIIRIMLLLLLLTVIGYFTCNAVPKFLKVDPPIVKINSLAVSNVEANGTRLVADWDAQFTMVNQNLMFSTSVTANTIQLSYDYETVARTTILEPNLKLRPDNKEVVRTVQIRRTSLSDYDGKTAQIKGINRARKNGSTVNIHFAVFMSAIIHDGRWIERTTSIFYMCGEFKVQFVSETKGVAILNKFGTTCVTFS